MRPLSQLYDFCLLQWPSDYIMCFWSQVIKGMTQERFIAAHHNAHSCCSDEWETPLCVCVCVRGDAATLIQHLLLRNHDYIAKTTGYPCLWHTGQTVFRLLSEYFRFLGMTLYFRFIQMAENYECSPHIGKKNPFNVSKKIYIFPPRQQWD